MIFNISIKRCFVIGLICVSGQNLVAQHENHEEESYEEHHCFNEHDSFSIGAGMPYSFHFETTGINARGYYNVNHQICFGPEFSFIQNSDASVFDIDIVGHYIFETPLVGIYPVAGINFTQERSNHERAESFGALFGGGIHRNFKRFIVFTEYTHIEGALQDDFVTLGLLYTL